MAALVMTTDLGQMVRKRVQAGAGFFQGRRRGAQGAAEAVAPLQQFQVRTVCGNAAHSGDGVSLRCGGADDNAGGNGEYLRRVQAVGFQQAAHGLLHPVDFRAAGHQTASNFRRQIQEPVVVHTAASVPHGSPSVLSAVLPAQTADPPAALAGPAPSPGPFCGLLGAVYHNSGSLYRDFLTCSDRNLTRNLRACLVPRSVRNTKQALTPRHLWRRGLVLSTRPWRSRFVCQHALCQRALGGRAYEESDNHAKAVIYTAVMPR